MKPRKIAIATSTRADWGLLSPIAHALRTHRSVEVSVIATNMHLDPLRGHTVDEIIADGFTPEACVEMTPSDDTPEAAAEAMGRCLSGMAAALSKISPDEIIILGDRFEMLAVASAATLLRIPIVHIAGGAISEGAVDDNIRHAITKLSSLHLTETERYRQRVISMGEDPQMVVNTGAIGVYNIMNLELMNREELEESVGFILDRDTLIVTMHPATTDDTTPTEISVRQLFDALDRFPELRLLITYPNNDANGSVIISMIDDYASRHADRVHVIPSLGRLRYLSALQFVGAVVGNSSSGIVEVPSAGIPTVNIRPRQNGRMAADSVITCDGDVDSIAEAITTALSDDFRAKAKNTPNPYFKSDTLQLMTDAILGTPVERLKHKKFHD